MITLKHLVGIATLSALSVNMGISIGTLSEAVIFD